MSTTDILLAAAGGDILFTRSTFSRIVTDSGTLNPPTGAVAMRVAVIGGGGGGYRSSTNYGGGGGGCAASKIVPASSITYSIGSAGAAGLNGGASTATFSGYSLVAGGGTANLGSGGVGSGGDYNYVGGAGAVGNTYGGGGGAAGPMGDGGPAGGPAPTLANDGWGVGGGGGGSGANTTLNFAGAGSGVGPGFSSTMTSTGVSRQGASPWGRSPDSGNNGRIGGEMGGGGSYNSTTSYGGGSGGMVVEWFY